MRYLFTAVLLCIVMMMGGCWGRVSPEAYNYQSPEIDFGVWVYVGESVKNLEDELKNGHEVDLTIKRTKYRRKRQLSNTKEMLSPPRDRLNLSTRFYSDNFPNGIHILDIGMATVKRPELTITFRVVESKLIFHRIRLHPIPQTATEPID